MFAVTYSVLHCYWRPSISDRIRNITIAQCNHQQRPLILWTRILSFSYNLRGKFTIMMGDLSFKARSDNAFLGHDERNDNGERLVNFCSFYRFGIGGTSFRHKACHKVSWVPNNQHRTSNQIDHFTISSKFRSCLLDAANKTDVYIGLERDHHLWFSGRLTLGNS